MLRLNFVWSSSVDSSPVDAHAAGSAPVHGGPQLALVHVLLAAGAAVAGAAPALVGGDTLASVITGGRAHRWK